jgi:hypothetical protein
MRQELVREIEEGDREVSEGAQCCPVLQARPPIRSDPDEDQHPPEGIHQVVGIQGLDLQADGEHPRLMRRGRSRRILDYRAKRSTSGSSLAWRPDVLNRSPRSPPQRGPVSNVRPGVARRAIDKS